jgi:hypothetical protein
VATKIKILNGATQVLVEEVVPGSKLAIAIYVERETAVEDVFAPFDSTGFTLKALVKAKEKDLDSAALVEFTVTARSGGDLGWYDLLLTGAQTTTVGTAVGEKEVYGSLKVWPTANPDAGETMAVFTLPVKYRAVH